LLWQLIVMMFRSALIAVFALALASCAAPPPAPVQPSVPPVAVTPPPPVAVVAPVVPPPAQPLAPPDQVIVPTAGLDFNTWVQAVRTEAVKRGMREALVTQALTGLTPSPRIIELDRAQTVARASFAAYRDRHVTALRTNRGRVLLEPRRAEMQRITTTYGVPPEIVTAIWAKESQFGDNIGSTPAIRALATLGYDGRRAPLFQRELFAALTLLDRNIVSLDQLRGSWAGALGQPQFMPSSYLEYGVDGDADGRVDLFADQADVFASIANFLKIHGWQAGLGWGAQVRLPDGFDLAAQASTDTPTKCVRALQRHSRWRSAAEWRQMGLTLASESATWPPEQTPMSVIAPDGPSGPVYVTTVNYRALLDYNCSNYYALAVALLSDTYR
jgi:membrane-bound lytic murein transglycosylase B